MLWKIPFALKPLSSHEKVWKFLGPKLRSRLIFHLILAGKKVPYTLEITTYTETQETE